MTAATNSGAGGNGGGGGDQRNGNGTSSGGGGGGSGASNGNGGGTGDGSRAADGSRASHNAGAFGVWTRRFNEAYDALRPRAVRLLEKGIQASMHMQRAVVKLVSEWWCTRVQHAL